MQSRSMIVKTKKYYNKKLCYTKYLSNITYPNELTDYFRNYLKNIPIRTISHGLTQKQFLPRITWFWILLWRAGITSSAPKSCIFIKLYRAVVNTEITKEKIRTGHFGSKLCKNSWTNGLLARKTIWAFSARLSSVNDTGCWLLLDSLVGSINHCLVVIPSNRADVGLWYFTLL